MNYSIVDGVAYPWRSHYGRARHALRCALRRAPRRCSRREGVPFGIMLSSCMSQVMHPGENVVGVGKRADRGAVDWTTGTQGTCDRCKLACVIP